MKSLIANTITIFLQASFKILEVERVQNEEPEYWIIKEFTPPTSNSVESFDYSQFRGIEITEKLDGWIATGQNKEQLLQKLEQYLDGKESIEMNVQFSPNHKWKLFS